MLIDYAKISVTAGKGGNGCSSFHREKFVPKGGPDGGNGGYGGSVIFKCDKNKKTLIDFKYKKTYVAESGENGQGTNKTGKSGEDLYIYVPIGTLLRDAETNEIIADLTDDSQAVTVVNGGSGGRGNAVFKSSTNRSPDYSELGLPGEHKNIILELKLLADAAIIGLPNAGKSTLLSVISAAKPKIADYPFTTLEPNLGVVKIGDMTPFVIADIPGLIENAHQGSGLGLKFLRHIERTKLFIHLIDINSDNMIKDFDTINAELIKYDEKLGARKQIVVVNKIDVVNNEYHEFCEEFVKYLDKNKNVLKICYISGVTGFGVNELVYSISELLKLPEIAELNTEIKKDDVKEYFFVKEEPVKVHDIGNNNFEITGDRILKALSRINISTDDGLVRFNKILDNYNINYLLKKAGAKNGDTVYIGEKTFDYYENK
ncbi:GTPase ObgE [Candidatus Dependentiae bacterium]|nr:GTPase ObgE [Candidatus Dependentiae bacterium]